MSGFNEFMGKVGFLANKAAEKTKDLAAVAAEKTKQVSRVTKLNMDISGQRETIRKAYAELGRLYYEAHKADPEPDLAQVCLQIDQANDAIASMEAEIARIKAESGESQDADFESVVDATAAEADVEVEVTVEEPAAPETPAEPETPVQPETPAPAEPPVEPETPAAPEASAEPLVEPEAPAAPEAPRED